MITKLANLYSKINPLWGLGGIIIVIVTIIIKVTIWIDHKSTQRVVLETRNESWIKRDSINHKQIDTFMTIVIGKLNNQSDSIRTANKGLRKNAKVMLNLQEYMEKKVATKDGLLEIQQIFQNDEKKNYYYEGMLTPYKSLTNQ
jgi:hypothetical protein